MGGHEGEVRDVEAPDPKTSSRRTYAKRGKNKDRAGARRGYAM